MDSGTENSDSQSPSIQSATDQPPSQKNVFEETHSDVDQKLLEEKGKDSSQSRENDIQRRGSEAKTNEEENCKKRRLKGRNSCNLSEPESCSNWESPRKRKRTSRDGLGKTAGASLEEMNSVTSEKIGKVSDADQSGDSKETGNACHGRAQRRRTGHSRRPRSRSSGVQTPPLLRKSLVTSLRTMSEAIYQNIVLLQKQQLPFSLSWEKYALLTQLREHLCTQVQTIYAWPPKQPMSSLLRAGLSQPHYQVPGVQQRMRKKKPRAPSRPGTWEGQPLPQTGDSRSFQ